MVVYSPFTADNWEYIVCIISEVLIFFNKAQIEIFKYHWKFYSNIISKKKKKTRKFENYSLVNVSLKLPLIFVGK